jgi:aldose 1-epimerase
VTARILPSVGFNCIGFTCRELEVVYPPPDAASLKTRPSGFGVPILFPFPNRIENGLFTFDGMTVQLDVPQAGPHAIHGFVLDKEWEVVDSSASNDDGAWVMGKVRSQDLPEITRQFPFPFELIATYRLKEEVLILEIEGRNVGNRTMPAGLGTHPYFPLPLTDGGRRGECSLKVPAQKYWPLREDCIPTGVSAEVQGKYDLRSTRPIGEETYDDVWTDVVGANGWSACEYEDPSAGAQIRIEADAAFREWVTYAPPDKAVICFEPYTCTTNAVNLDTREIDGGLVRLSPGESLGGVVRISCLDGTGS